jgi:hypothetical protein
VLGVNVQLMSILTHPVEFAVIEASRRGKLIMSYPGNLHTRHSRFIFNVSEPVDCFVISNNHPSQKCGLVLKKDEMITTTPSLEPPTSNRSRVILMAKVAARPIHSPTHAPMSTINIISIKKQWGMHACKQAFRRSVRQSDRYSKTPGLRLPSCRPVVVNACRCFIFVSCDRQDS